MKWNLEYLFKTREDFLNSVEELDSYIERLYKYKDHLADEKEFVNYLLLSDVFVLFLSDTFVLFFITSIADFISVVL